MDTDRNTRRMPCEHRVILLQTKEQQCHLTTGLGEKPGTDSPTQTSEESNFADILNLGF